MPEYEISDILIL